MPIDNNWIENQIRPIAIGRKNWLCRLAARGKLAAAIMSLIQSARLNGHEPFAYLKDVLTACRRSRRVGSVSCCRIGGGPIQPGARSRGLPGAYRRSGIDSGNALLNPSARSRLVQEVCLGTQVLEVMSAQRGFGAWLKHKFHQRLDAICFAEQCVFDSSGNLDIHADSFRTKLLR